MSPLSPNQWTILGALTKGPSWIRSFQTVKPLLDDLIDRGLVGRCRPFLGRARNMVRLTAAGCEMLDISPKEVPASRDKPKIKIRTFKPVLGAIRSDAPPRARSICEAFLKRISGGALSEDIVGELAAKHDVQRPAIWKSLRSGGVLAPYGSKENGGKGRPLGGGCNGYSERRRERSIKTAEERRPEPSPEQFVDRDPCPRCGVRRDYGCSHSLTPLGMVL